MKIRIRRKGKRVWVESENMPDHYKTSDLLLYDRGFPCGRFDIEVSDSCIPLLSQADKHGRISLKLNSKGDFKMVETRGYLAETRDEAKLVFEELKASLLFYVSCKKKLGRAIAAMAGI